MKETMTKFKKYLLHPSFFLLRLDERGVLRLKDDHYLGLKYWEMIGRKIDLDSPKTFNEKIQWLKLHDRNPRYTKLVDKAEAKKIVAEQVGEEYVITTLGVYDEFDKINFEKLPNQFVIKCTHDSGGIAICKDKNTFDFEEAKKKIECSLKRNFYWQSREWPYKDIKPRILVETFEEDSKTKDLKDYKFFMFGGKIGCIQVDYDRFTNHKRAFYDENWNRLHFTTCYPTDYKVEQKCPENFKKMKELATELVKVAGTPAHVRIDLYSVNGKIYFGEFTFYHGGGFEKFDPPEWDEKIGDLLELPKRGE